MKIRSLSVLFLLLMLACTSSKQSIRFKRSYLEIEANVGYFDLEIGNSTLGDVENKLGNAYEEIKHGTFSTEANYTKKGVSFYYCQKDTSKTIFSMKFSAPFKGKTKEGVFMYGTTMNEIVEKYGEPDWSTSSGSLTWSNNYTGISFLVKRDTSLPQFPLNEERHLSEKIIGIDVSNNCQCSSKF
jgi:hypothetical protein